MTSVKCFSSWFKEAGRGHMTAFLGWGSMVLYGILMLTRLSFDTEYTFFGIGNTEGIWLCAGLGLFFAFLEFFYLFQQKKQDFYYSLPVSRNIIFWSRYVHGVFHFFVPLILVMTVCGLYQAGIDTQFAPFSGSYTGKSILIFAGVFFLFYHMGILCVTVCGHLISGLLVCAGIIFYFRILIGMAFVLFASNFFETYYRIPLLEKLQILLSPMMLAKSMGGGGLYRKADILDFVPRGEWIAGLLIWIVLLLFLFTLSHQKRKTESTGQVFVLLPAERVCEIGFAFLAGVWTAGFILDLSGLGKSSRLAGGLLSAAISVAAAAFVHFLLEGIVKNPGAKLLRRKYQLIISCAAAAVVGISFSAGASSYDTYFPEEAAAVSISIDGIGMNYDAYMQAAGDREEYETEEQLKKYVLTEKGRSAALGWLRDIGSAEDVYTRATVCYHMENGTRRYRTYPLTREEVEAFASVYETEEYKRIAYPAVELEDVEENRFTWDDGVIETGLKLTEEDKRALIEAYKADVFDLTMAKLAETPPSGIVRIKSAGNGEVTEMPVYPFFERTCELLNETGTDTGRTLADYPIESVEVRENLLGVPAGKAGGVSMSFYEQPEEVDEWKRKLISYELDLQPLLYPLDHSKEIKAVIEDVETNSLIYVDCVQRQ